MIFFTIPIMGLFVSLVSVFIGLGGGILLVPLLPDYFGLTVHEAVATSLLTIVFVVTDNTYKFHKQKLVHWPVVLLMGPASAITAVVASQLSQKVDGDYISMALLVVLLLVAIKTLFSSVLKKKYIPNPELSGGQKIFSAAGGGFAGFVSGFAGVGSGVILSPIMIFVRSVTPAQLSPTANANMMCTTFAASMSLIFSGEFVKWNQWGLIRWDISIGIFLSASIFSHFLRPHQNKLPFKAKSLILGLLLLFLIYKISNRLDLLNF